MNGPTKILAFKRPHPAALRLVPTETETFPRFHLEWNRPNPRPPGHPLDPAATPPSGK